MSRLLLRSVIDIAAMVAISQAGYVIAGLLGSFVGVLALMAYSVWCYWDGMESGH